MSRIWSYRAVTAPLVAVAILVLVLGSSPFPAYGQGLSPQLTAQIAAPSAPLPVDPAIAESWLAADGAVLRGEAQRPWVWGPFALAITVEHVPGTGERRSIYFDKGRIDIAEPDGDRTSPWYAAGAPLVTELLAGAVRVGPETWVDREDALIPVTGDMEQPDPITYATLGKLASLPSDSATEAGPNDRKIGARVTALLQPAGNQLLNGVPMSDVTIGAYDDVTGRNIAQPFVAWMETLPDPALPVVGHPLTEPYWIDTVIGGENRRVLVQAFERRVLTYVPSNPTPWQVESANSGAHYRLWRGLERPEDPKLAALASSVPFGEEIIAAATEQNIDPFLLVSIARVASAGNPLADPGTGHRGLLGITGAIDGDVNDPAINARAGASSLARIAAESGDPRATLARFYAGDGDPASPSATAFVDAVTATQAAMEAAFSTPDESTSPVTAGTATVAPGYDSAWFERALAWYASWGGALADAEADPAGNYCAVDGAVPGARLRLTSDRASLECTVGSRLGMLGLPNPSNGLIVSPNVSDALGLGEGAAARVSRAGTNADLPSEQTQVNASFTMSGAAAYYDPDYDRAWWDRTIALHASWGNAVAGWQVDPNGYYCVHPDYRPGQRLRLVANGVTLDCTIGDSVQDAHKAMWRSRWAVELSWDTFQALGLAGNNRVEVYALQ